MSSPSIKMKVLAPTLFDRVFMIPIDPDIFEIDVSETTKHMEGRETFLSKEMMSATETFTTHDGREALRLKPRPRNEGYSTLQDVFVSVSSVTVEAD